MMSVSRRLKRTGGTAATTQAQEPKRFQGPVKTFALAVFSVLALTTVNIQAQSPSGALGITVDLRDEIRDSFIFVFREEIPANDVHRLANALASAHGGRITRVYTMALKGFAAKMPAGAAARLAAGNPSIAYYEPDGVAFAFAKPASKGGGATSACDPQQTPWGVTRVGGPGNGTATGHRGWVIDTGIDLTNPDLNVDVAHSANFVLRGKDTPDDGNGHGTHVAGTIGAIDNGCDAVGVAAGVPLVAVRVLDNSGSGSYSGVIAGVDYVAAHAVPGDVANMSLGGPKSDALNQAVVGAASRGIYFTIAAGNSSDDAAKYSPASAEDPVADPYIYTVSAIDNADRFAWFSNYGDPPTVDCAEPGVNILSLRRGGGTTTMSGTSMAAPHLAGILLLGPSTWNSTALGDPDNAPDPICTR